MKHPAEEIVEFNQQILRIEQREIGLLNQEELDLTNKCLNEEVKEFNEAHDSMDLVGCVDAMVDLIYFATGVMYKLGLTDEQIKQCQAAVHQANMTKIRGAKPGRETGNAADAIKPDGWISPEERIAEILGG